MTAGAQDFILSNPVLTSTNLRETVTFEFRTTKAYTFSKDDLSNEYASITFSLGSLQPSGDKPKGSGAELFDWVLTSQLSQGKIPVYTWVGKTRSVKMNANTTYKIAITVEKPLGNAAGRRPAEDIMITGQFSDPGNVPSGNEANNTVSANRRQMNKERNKEREGIAAERNN